MLKILFSPSESKYIGGNSKFDDLLCTQKAREEILITYNNLINSENEETIKKLFGFKNYNDCKPYLSDIFSSPLIPAIQRYSGVAYNYLDFNTLNQNAQKYLKQNTIIFSNLYGPILGGDTIANYKVKQGNSIGDIIPDKFYKERFSYQLDLYLNNNDILDLRAGYYDKFYKPTKSYTTLKFLKDGKAISHWAKAYRGLILRKLAQQNIDNLQDFISLEIDNLQIKEIKIIKNKREIIYNIV